MWRTTKSFIRRRIVGRLIPDLYFRLSTLIQGRITEDRLSEIFEAYITDYQDSSNTELVRKAFLRDFVTYVCDWDAQTFKDLDDPFLGWPIVDQYVDEFEEFVSTQTYEPGGMINSALIVVYSLIRHCKPRIFIESGTKNGYSSVIIAEALKQNNNNSKLFCLSLFSTEEKRIAMEKLQHYPFVNIVEGNSERNIDVVAEKVGNDPVGVLVDGPKARSVAWDILTEKIQRYFPHLQFMCFDSCQEHVPYYLRPATPYHLKRGINMERLKVTKLWEKYFLARDYSLTCQSNQFCSKYGYLNRDMYAYRNDSWGQFFPWGPFQVDRLDGHVAHSYKLGTIYCPDILRTESSGDRS